MTAARTYTLRFEMLSDWHVGAGFGRPGSVDRLLLRDADDLPFLPAKTVRGMWRDAAERLAAALGEGWAPVVDRIFGDQPAQNDRAEEARPRQTALVVTPARLPAKLREQLTASPDLRAAAAFVKPGVKIDPASGRAEDQHLRFEEVARAGAVLTATATFDPARAGDPAAEYLLLAATRLVTRVGGKRRRGNGRCAVTVRGADVDAAIDRLETATPAAPAVPAVEPSQAAVGGPTKAGAAWVSLPFAVELRGPVAAAARTVGNVVKSLDFLPGTYLLPHVTRAFPALRPAVARGEVVVTHATADVGGAAGLPMPFALFAPKGKGFADGPSLVNRLTAAADGTDQLKQLRGGYVGPGPDGPTAERVGKTVRTHNVIDDGPQRPTAAVGGVYSYEAIAPGQVLRGAILARGDLLPADAPTRLSGTVRLGSSKKDDYGEAALTVFAEANFEPLPGGEQSTLTVWLLSDALLRDAALRPDPTPDGLRRELSERLGVELTSNGAFARQRRTESWHTGWGLPRPSLVGLQAGTCVRFKVEGKLAAAALAAVAAAGVGERTAEGYGRVAFDHPLLTNAPMEWSNAGLPAAGGVPAPAPPDDDPEPAAEFATVIEAAAWKAAVHTAALHATDTADGRAAMFGWEGGAGRSKPTLSQLGGLRAVLPFLRTWADAGKVTGWLDAVSRNARRADKWPDGALARTGDWFRDPAAVWAELRRQKVEFPTLGAAGAARLEAALWAFAVRALFDAGVRAHKRDTERPPAPKEATRGT